MENISFVLSFFLYFHILFDVFMQYEYILASMDPLIDLIFGQLEHLIGKTLNQKVESVSPMSFIEPICFN